MQKYRSELEKVFAIFCDESNKMPRSNALKALRTLGYVLEDDFMRHPTKELLSLEDFTELSTKARDLALNREKIEEAFKLFDSNRTGYIKASEFKQILTSGPDGLTETDVNILFESFPPNDQGMICYGLPISYVFDNLSSK